MYNNAICGFDIFPLNIALESYQIFNCHYQHQVGVIIVVDDMSIVKCTLDAIKLDIEA